jgi:hypothetical protein
VPVDGLSSSGALLAAGAAMYDWTGLPTYMQWIWARMRSERPPIKSLVAVEVEPSQVPFVVPIVSHTSEVGPGFAKRLAARGHGTFTEEVDDIGLTDDFSTLRGPDFDPAQVDPLIRELYEHTTRFTLDVVPHWSPIYKPAFWLFRKLFAERVGQLNLPFDAREAAQGIESHIDTIDFNDGKTIDLRCWVRVYRRSRLSLYIGFYTTLRHNDRGYVSVGFPLPFASLTSTLRPTNRGARLLLRTRREDGTVAGDYISLLNPVTDRLTVFRIPQFHEEIEVFVEDGQLVAHHRFYFVGRRFLTLVFTIHRKPNGTRRPVRTRG